MIDLRSDTVTQPTEAMRRVMAWAEVGDDVYGEDPTVRALEERVAAMFGHEAALFTATGSLANLLGVGLLVAPGEEILCEASAHVARAELGAHAALSGITMRTWTVPPRQVGLDQIAAMVAVDPGGYLVRTAALSVENTHNFSGGTVLPLADLQALHHYTAGLGLPIHLDGARIWNAHIATGEPLSRYGGLAAVMTVCLSKGLGAPVGSLLIGSASRLAEARIRRKRLGGGWRQAGVLAAAGQHALDHHVERLADDHVHARLVAEACGIDPSSVDTNILILPTDNASDFSEAARAAGVLVSTMGGRAVRVVTHLDVSRADTERAAAVLARLVRPKG